MIRSGIPIVVERQGEMLDLDLVQATPGELAGYLNRHNDKQLRLMVEYLLRTLREASNKTSDGIVVALNLIQEMNSGSYGSALCKGGELNHAENVLEGALGKDENVYQNSGWMAAHVKSTLYT